MPRFGRNRPQNLYFRPNHSGVHFLVSGRVIDRLVRECGVCATDLVLEFGAGQGAVTSRLARTGATVVAVERDPEFVRKLRQRHSCRENVRVVPADARTVPLPHRAFSVVSSIPYAISTALIRRLLTPQWTNLQRAALIVEWGFARRMTAVTPRDQEAAWWAARFEMELVTRVPAAAFRPQPVVDSAHLSIRRVPGLTPHIETVLWALLGIANLAGRTSARSALQRTVGAGRARRALLACEVDPSVPARSVPARTWSEIARVLAREPGLHWPRLPAELTTGNSARSRKPGKARRR